MYTVTDGTTSLSPTLVLDYSTVRPARSLVHEVLGSPSPDITLRPMGTREGVLSLFCLTRADATAIELLHTEPRPLTFIDPDAAPMRYVVHGTVTVTYLADADRWRVDASFREVTP